MIRADDGLRPIGCACEVAEIDRGAAQSDPSDVQHVLAREAERGEAQRSHHRADDERQSRALHGLTRALVNNMILGVKNGYEEKL